MSPRIIGLLLAVGLVAIGLAAAGDHRPRAEVIKRADAICRADRPRVAPLGWTGAPGARRFGLRDCGA